MIYIITLESELSVHWYQYHPPLPSEAIDHVLLESIREKERGRERVRGDRVCILRSCLELKGVSRI